MDGTAIDLLDDVLRRAVRLLAQLTRQVAIVQYPTLSASTVRHLEVVALTLGGDGAVLVTADELPEGAKGLRIRSRLNGEVMQDANTSDMIFPVDETIALLAECMTLEPGDAIIMGTPAGVGQARTPPVWMKAGDTIEIEIEKIGVLSNPIVAEG